MIGIRQAALFALPLVAILAACSLKDGHCIAMSDCDDGMTCNEGLCQTDSPGDTILSADADTSSIGNDGSSSSSSHDSSTTTAVDAAVEAADAADASMTDAPSDS